MPEPETTLHRDLHVDSEYEHVTLVTDDVIATFHRNRDELATVLHDNITVLSDRELTEALIGEILEQAQGVVAPVVKYNAAIHHAVRWACLECDDVYTDNPDVLGTPRTCPDCDVLLVREGSPKWLAHDEFPNQRIFQ